MAEPVTCGLLLKALLFGGGASAAAELASGNSAEDYGSDLDLSLIHI